MKYLGDNRGSVAVIVTLTITALLGILALSVDSGYLFVVRNQLQNAADAGALAGAALLGYAYGVADGSSEQLAMQEAIDYATRHLAADRSVYATDVAVDFGPASNFGVAGVNDWAIRVIVRRTSETTPVDLFFSRIFGRSQGDVVATAVARMAPLTGVCELRPWMVRDKGGNGFELNEEVTLYYSRSDVKNGTIPAPGWFSPIDFPVECSATGKEWGADAYRDNLLYGSSCDSGCTINIGDSLWIEPGAMVGPTLQGAEDLLGQTIKIPLFNYDIEVSSGRQQITISRLAAFQVTEVLTGLVRVNNVGIRGTFVGYVTGGMSTGVPGASLGLFIPQLIK